MERQRPVITGQEKEALIQRIWVDKSGRVDRGWGLALYVALDSPRPNLAQITNMVLDRLAEDSSTGFSWAEDWGRVVVCVAPGLSLGCVLGDMKDPDNKRFVPVHTSRKLEADELQSILDTLPQAEGSLGTVLLNSQATTIEGFLISYIHMVDQAVWDIYRRTDFQSKTGLARKYLLALERYTKEGFSVRLATEEGILMAKLANDKVSVRLYGSQVNPDVPRVMGAVVPRGDI